jgi:surfeit locus 1 family protein
VTATLAARRGRTPLGVILFIVDGLLCGVPENTKVVPALEVRSRDGISLGMGRRIFIVVLLLTALGFVRLGFWQLERLRERRAANQVAAAARQAPPLRLPKDLGELSDAKDRRIEAAGRYDRANEILVRGQALNGLPGLHVITPLRMEGTDTALLVNRGFISSPDAVTADTAGLDEEGPKHVTGIAVAIGTGGGQPIDRRGQITWARLDREALSQLLPYPILRVALLQAPDSTLPRLPRRLTPAPLDDGPHLNYAIQWFLFAALAAGFAIVVVARGRS